MENLSATEFKTAIESNDNAVVIDVRTPEEEAEGKIEQAINMNIMDQAFPAKVMDLDNAKDYYVFCRSGGRSVTACQFMEKQGLKTFNLLGGIQAWNNLQSA